MNSIGVDLSKNHYGLCYIDNNDNYHFRYVYFKPFLKRDKPSSKYSKIIEQENIGKDFSFELRCYKYDDKKYNMIQVDALKSKLFIESIFDFLYNIKGEKFITLEDYVYSGGKVVQLVHVTESFKYKLSEMNGVILFICPNVTWKKWLCPGISTKTKNKKNLYEGIDNCLNLLHKDVKTIIDSFKVKYDIYKDLVDAFALAYMEKCNNAIFKETYKKRIFQF